MIANIAGADGIIVLIVALVVLVGGSQLPKIARNIGLAGKEFRKAQAEAEEEQAKAKASAAAVPPPVALPATPPAGAASSAPVAPPTATAGPAPAAAAPAGDDSITLSPAQLEALLKAREEQAR
ncbi:MAG TPA: twin-arginine translocase TatA/TatE family subunit, partial [Acidimicrobiales bacterium]|nr:twin-arginine translocase TatA/TatE family subunit [Acidimicrobiales bacterium]